MGILLPRERTRIIWCAPYNDCTSCKVTLHLRRNSIRESMRKLLLAVSFSAALLKLSEILIDFGCSRRLCSESSSLGGTAFCLVSDESLDLGELGRIKFFPDLSLGCSAEPFGLEIPGRSNLGDLGRGSVESIGLSSRELLPFLCL